MDELEKWAPPQEHFIAKCPVFLAHLLTEIDAMDNELFPPQHPIQRNDTVIGVASLYARKVYSLWLHTNREREHIELDQKYASKDEPGHADATNR